MNKWAEEEISLDKTPVSQALRSTIDKWNLMKLQSFCKAKDTVNNDNTVNLQIGKKIFSKPVSDRRLIYNIYREFKNLDSREPNNLIKNWGAELHKEFSTEEYRKAEKHLKKCSISSRKCKSKQESTSHQSEWAKIKNSGDSRC